MGRSAVASLFEASGDLFLELAEKKHEYAALEQVAHFAQAIDNSEIPLPHRVGDRSLVGVVHPLI